LTLVSPHDDRLLGQAHFLRGSVQSALALYREAEASFKSSSYHRKAANQWLAAGRAEGNLANVLGALGNRMEARAAALRAKELFLRVEDADLLELGLVDEQLRSFA
jgi:tetratricopeptide (TPR) repeat protein